ncbi:putative E3 ubiquitin-protein ligase ARI9 [Ceratocystis platani]|uniref:RBR-type E3 ubiquitin transferase n=1 Tax=Ceratocystis fimbriata f. sp. platani TaxID=88771 RepID=A0A0F8BU75_CERFI|nr:putative E3 ubiquitin-protein ligase ARI9 [Ceratocystis platani]
MTQILMLHTEDAIHSVSSSPCSPIEPLPLQSDSSVTSKEQQTPKFRAQYTDPFEYYDGLLGFGDDKNWHIEVQFPDIKDKGKGKAAERSTATILAELTEDLDQGRKWVNIEPPLALYNVSEGCPAAVAELAEIANKNIMARAAEEKAKDEAEQAKKAEAAAAAEAAALAERQRLKKTDEPYLPIILPEEMSKNTISITASEKSGHGKSASQRNSSQASLSNSSTEDLTFSENTDEKIWDRVREIQEQRVKERQEKVELQKRESVKMREAKVANKKKKKAAAVQVECVSCLDDFDSRVTVRVTCHNYCFECFERLIEACTTNEAQWPPKCCLNTIDFKLIKRYCSASLRRTVQARSNEWNVPVSERVYCSQTSCGLFIAPPSINLAERRATCNAGHRTCTLCRGPHHGQGDCPADQDLEQMTVLAGEMGWKRCLDCRAMVEHREACQHMTCRCGAQFCYVCGQRWRSCGCSMADLSRVKEDAAVRTRERQQREAAEAVEAEELRQALAQIEEFEREEARKAELLRQEHARLEKDRRRIEYARRKTAELARQNQVEENFVIYNVAMEALGEMQIAQMARDHGEAMKALKEEATEAQRLMEVRNAVDKESVEAEGAGRLRELRQQLDSEMEERAAHAKRLADDYDEKLRNFYQSHSNADVVVSTAMAEYSAKHELGYRQWQAWRAGKEEALQFEVDEKQALREEANDVRRRRLEDSFGQRAEELESLETATRQWTELVMTERRRLLRARENMEKNEMGDLLEDFEEDEKVDDVNIEMLLQEQEKESDCWWILQSLLEAFHKVTSD